MSTFIGRERELDALLEVARAATTGRGRVALVEATAGGGKTALVDELVRRVDGAPDLAGLNVARGQSYDDYSVQNAFQPFAEALADLAGARGDRDRRRARLVVELLGGSVPDLLAMLPVVGPVAAAVSRVAAQAGGWVVGAAEEPRSIPLQFVQAFTEIAGSLGPLLVVVEDAHWCDLSSIALLKRLARTVQQAPLSVVVTYRPPHSADDVEDAPERTRASLELERVALELRAARQATYLPLRPFGAEEVAAYIAATYGPDASDQLSAWLSGNCGGQPLFVSAYLALLEESGRLRPGGAAGSGSWFLAAELDSLPVPDSIEALLRLRARAVRGTERVMLQVAAVQGQEFLATVLASSMSVGEAEVVLSLQAVREASGVITDAAAEDWARDWSDAFSFEHQLLQRTFYAELTHRQRIAGHRSAGAVLRDRVAATPRPSRRLVLETARHLEAGEEWLPAAEHFRLAARSSYFDGALSEGASLAATGLECLRRGAADGSAELARTEARLVQLLLICSELAWWSAPESIEGHDVMALLASADAAAVRAHDPKLATELTFLRAKVMLVRSSLKDAVELFERSAELALAHGDALGEVISRAEVGHHLAGIDLRRASGILHAAHDAWETDPRLQQEVPPSTRARHRCRLEGALGAACFDLGRFDEAERWLVLSSAEARRRRLPDLAGQATSFHAQLLIATGRYEEALGLLDDALGARVGEGEAVVFRAYLRALVGKTYLEWGRPDDAVAPLTRAWEQARDLVNTAVLPLIRNYYCELLLDERLAVHAPDQAQRLAKQTLVETVASGFVRSDVAARTWLAVANRQTRNPRKALQWADSALVRLRAAGGVLPALRTEEVYFVHSRCAADAGRVVESAHSLALAHDEVERKAVSIADPRGRARFLETVPLNRAIAEAWSADH